MPEKVTSWNKEYCKEQIDKGFVDYIITKNGRRKIINLANKQELMDGLEDGATIKRKLRDGDVVIFNRQPTLHRASIMGHKIKVLPGKTFRLNPIACPPYNADFDGDEMNLHCPQSEAAVAEINNLLMVDSQILSIRNGSPIIVIHF